MRVFSDPYFPVQGHNLQLYGLIMSRTRFRVNPHSTDYGVRDMTRTYRQMHRTDKYSQHSSNIIFNSGLLRENTGNRKPVFWNILRIECL